MAIGMLPTQMNGSDLWYETEGANGGCDKWCRQQPQDDMMQSAEYLTGTLLRMFSPFLLCVLTRVQNQTPFPAERSMYRSMHLKSQEPHYFICGNKTRRGKGNQR